MDETKQDYCEKDFDLKEEFSLSGTIFGDGVKSGSSSPFESPLENGLLGDGDNCSICMGPLDVPRLLSCLHVFCEHCLNKKFPSGGGGGDAGCISTIIECPICKQDTKIDHKRMNSLPMDVMSTHISDVTNTVNLQCTSCTAKEIAISRCSTCHNLLCDNCEKAHRFMRLFETHEVVSLDEMRKEGKKITIHKPLLCVQHGEPVVHYCATCETPVCTECVKVEHSGANGHKCDQIIESEPRVREELHRLLEDTKSTIKDMYKTANNLDNALSELANQKCTAKDLINETYQSYKAILEKCRGDALDKLSDLYRDRELKIMDMTQKVGNETEQLEDASKYASRVLELGTGSEIMYLRSVVTSQLINLIKNSSTLECDYSLEFLTDIDEFEATVTKVFGSFRTECPPKVKVQDLSMLNNSEHSMPPLILNGSMPDESQTTSSPVSLPTSMQSSFDGDLTNSMPGLTLSATPPIPAGNSQALQGFNSMAEYNIAQLASLAENANPAASPTQQPFLSDLFTTDTAFKNLQSLAKLGFNNGDTMSNGSSMLMRSASPALTNNLLNGYAPVSSSTSPLLSTPDDMTDGLGQARSGPPVLRAGKFSPMQIRCKFGQLGSGRGQFNSPHGFCLGLDEDIVVADTNNHRIQVYDKNGTFRFQFGVAGKDEGQLWYPRKVAVMRSSGKYVVCDRGNERSRMQIFTKNGHFLKKIAIRYIDIVAGLAVTTTGEIVAVDSVSPTVFVISENGDLIRWFDCSDYMREPSDIAIHGKEFYVCDFKGHNVVVFSDDGNFVRRIGYDTLTCYPNGIDISDAGDVLIGDSHGNRFHVAVFTRTGDLISEFECPYVKVSRCCGLKITSEGYVVTLAKNNHHVLVLNTLYIL